MEFRHLLLLTIWFFAALSSRGELAVGKAEWGFDGKVKANTFNVLSVEVRNTGANAYEGEISLDDRRFGQGSGAPYRKSIYLAPGTAQIVQFYPLMPSYSGEWRLSWKGGRDAEASLGEIKFGVAATVLLADPQSPSLRGVKMQVFNEANFPPTVSATDGLHAVVLDHQPRWDPARREAFLDWLKLGGIVHLALGPDGVAPKFTDEFAILNNPTQTAQIGLGTVVKHATPRNEISVQFLEKAGYAPPPEPTQQNYYGQDNQLFRMMADATRPNIAWWLIYLLTGVYVLLIGPVFYFYRKRDYRLVLCGFLVTVALFAWIFTVVGRRGYGEKQLYHQMAIARSLGGDRWDVQHWVHPFATSGDTYRFAYPGPSQLFAAAGDGVRGEVAQGKDGNRYFSADIPLFSSRPFMHRGVLSGVDAGLGITEVKVDKNGRLEKLRLRANPEMSKQTRVAIAQLGLLYYRLKVEEGGLTLLGQEPTSTVARIFDNLEYSPENGTNQTGIHFQHFGSLLAKVMSGETEQSGPTQRFPSPAQGTLRVLLFAQSPKPFELVTEQFLPGASYVFYTQDLVLPTTTPTQP